MQENTTAAIAATPENTASERAKAAASKARIQIPISLDNWRHLAEELQTLLLWFHQRLLDQGMTLDDAAEAIGYEKSVVFRVIKGTYEGSWPNILAALKSYRRIATNRGMIQKTEFVETRTTRMIFAGLDYAVSNNSISLVIGESGQGKSIAARAWRDRNNHGRSVLVEARPIGGAGGLLGTICGAIGGVKHTNQMLMLDRVLKAFNPNRVLIVDEAHRLMPSDRRSNPQALETLRHIHDVTGCALALIATQKFDDGLRASHYQFEQLLGRADPVRLYRESTDDDVLPILQQYFPTPSARLLSHAVEIANTNGRIRDLGKVLALATRFAAKAKEPLSEEHFIKSLAFRAQMRGETTFAAKGGRQ